MPFAPAAFVVGQFDTVQAAFSSSLNQKIKNCKLDKVSAEIIHKKKGIIF